MVQNELDHEFPQIMFAKQISVNYLQTKLINKHILGEHKMFRRKKTLGFGKKQRTKEEIDKDYTHTSVQIGHKARVIAQLQSEVDEHVQRLIEINAEAMRLPADPQPPPVPNMGRPEGLHAAMTQPEGGAA